MSRHRSAAVVAAWLSVAGAVLTAAVLAWWAQDDASHHEPEEFLDGLLVVVFVVFGVPALLYAAFAAVAVWRYRAGRSGGVVMMRLVALGPLVLCAAAIDAAFQPPATGGWLALTVTGAVAGLLAAVVLATAPGGQPSEPVAATRRG